MPNLVLYRKCGERIRIGPDIWVTVVKIRHSAAFLAIEAPPEVQILREELLDPSEFRVLPEDTKEPSDAT